MNVALCRPQDHRYVEWSDNEAEGGRARQERQEQRKIPFGYFDPEIRRHAYWHEGYEHQASPNLRTYCGPQEGSAKIGVCPADQRQKTIKQAYTEEKGPRHLGQAH